MVSIWKKPVNFFARREHFIDHMLPVWDAMEGKRGRFFVPEECAEYAQARIKEGLEVVSPKSATNPLQCGPTEAAPTFVSAYGDLQQVIRYVPQSPTIMMEHGVGLTFSGHPGYAGGIGLRNRVSLFLAPNEVIRKQTQKAIPRARQVVVGTPKLDYLRNSRSAVVNKKPVVCISFHWDGSKVAPEAGNALRHYRAILPELAVQSDFELVGHSHPKYRDVLRGEFEGLGVRFIENFADVLNEADLYVNDCSSTMYEFCVTGKPVVILNAPWFRRNVNHGIRFWDYTDIGPQVDEPQDLVQVVKEQLKGGSTVYDEARGQMMEELYPHFGYAAQRAAGAILGFTGAVRG